MGLVRISTPQGARELLKRLIEAKRCTLEDLDTPPPGHINPQGYRNLLRDVAAPPKVEVVSPRDLPTQPLRNADPEQPEEPLPF